MVYHEKMFRFDGLLGRDQQYLYHWQLSCFKSWWDLTRTKGSMSSRKTWKTKFAQKFWHLWTFRPLRHSWYEGFIFGSFHKLTIVFCFFLVLKWSILVLALFWYYFLKGYNSRTKVWCRRLELYRKNDWLIEQRFYVFLNAFTVNWVTNGMFQKTNCEINPLDQKGVVERS